MKPRGLLLPLCAFCAWVSVALADPAVLLKAYPAEIIRGRYVLGQRIVRIGERVSVLAINGAKAAVATREGDPLEVYLADLRTVTEVSAPTSTAAPAPAKAPEPTPLLLPNLPATPVSKEAAKESSPVGARLETSVRCTHLTKKGTQCTRKTKSPNGFCWQHGGD